MFFSYRFDDFAKRIQCPSNRDHLSRPIGNGVFADPESQTSTLFERAVILAPVADAVSGFLFHDKKSLPLHCLRSLSD